MGAITAPSVLGLPQELHGAYVFDMDGTTYLGDHLLPGAARLIEELRRRSIPLRFLSNNPTKDPEECTQKLAKLGLPIDVADIANTVVTTTAGLKSHRPDDVSSSRSRSNLSNGRWPEMAFR